MTIEAEIFTRLSTETAFDDLVAGRVYPLQAPQGVAAPFVVYRQIDAVRESGMGADSDVVACRIQLDAFAATYDDVKEVATELRKALQRWRNPALSTPVLETYIATEADFLESEIGLYRSTTDIQIWYRES